MGQYGSDVNGLFIGLYGVFYFIYRMLDEMDGKQARKTGNSSPLGLLFDHGCDSFSIGFVILTTSKILAVDDSNFNFFYVFGPVALFYITTLEEYYVGGLHLKPGNGVTDGSFPLIIGLIILGFTGNEVTQKEIIKGNENTKAVNIAVFFCMGLYICTFLTNFYNILTRPKDLEIGEPVKFKEFFIQIFSYLLIVGLMQSLAYIGDEPLILESDKKQFSNGYFYLLML
jgi:phosphatidylglycerophosphate synthase